MYNERIVKWMSGGVFLTCFIVGYFLALNRPLTNNEIFSQDMHIEGRTYAAIILGGETPVGSRSMVFNTIQKGLNVLGIHLSSMWEGNQSPLFYVLQKSLCNLLNYDFPYKYFLGVELWDKQAQSILRFSPIVFMSLAITTLFYYFARNYTFWLGIFAIFIFLTTSQWVWYYWVQARPYAMWVFLIILQSCLFLEIIKSDQPCQDLWRCLTGVHIVMMFVFIATLPQILIVSVLLWMFKERNWRKYIWLTGVPMFLFFYYYFMEHSYAFDAPVIYLIGESLPGNHVIFFSVYILIIFSINFKKGQSSIFKAREKVKEENIYLVLMLLSILAAFIMAGIFFLKAALGVEQTQQVSARYFIYLTPISAIAVTLFVKDLFSLLRKKYLKTMCFVFVCWVFLYKSPIIGF